MELCLQYSKTSSIMPSSKESERNFVVMPDSKAPRICLSPAHSRNCFKLHSVCREGSSSTLKFRIKPNNLYKIPCKIYKNSLKYLFPLVFDTNLLSYAVEILIKNVLNICGKYFLDSATTISSFCSMITPINSVAFMILPPTSSAMTKKPA